MTTGGQIPLLDDRPDGTTPERALTVSALNGATRRLLEERVPRLWVRGEIANWRAVPSGHRYFTLRDDAAQVDCALFRGDAWRLPADPDDGTEVVVFGRATLYEQRGRFQVVVERLEATGDGLWRLAFERLYRKLDGEGLLDPARKRPLPAFPRRIGVATSRSGAALRDVVSVLRRRSPWVDVVVADCRVQGEGAALEIRDALARLARLPDVDTVILTRGGGSIEDLWSFNDEVTVRAVAACPRPVICAVGHEVDVTLAELVADLRAPTPSVAAELAAPDREALFHRLDGLSAGLGRGLRRRVERGRDRLSGVGRRLPDAIGRRLDRARGALATQAGRLDALSPLRTLARGYAIATDARGRLLSRTDQFRVGEAFRLRVRDGSVSATVRGIEDGESGS